MIQSVEQIILHTIVLEGGYVCNPNDPGGETKFGISKRSYPTIDIKNLTEDDAVIIYKNDFWEKMNLNLLTSEIVAQKVFDIGVNMGQSIPIRFLQEIVSAKVDGILGSQTANLVNAENPMHLVNELRRKQIQRYAQIVVKDTSKSEFLIGWINRAFA